MQDRPRSGRSSAHSHQSIHSYISEAFEKEVKEIRNEKADLKKRVKKN